jgi:serine/threonine protein kinase
MNSTPQCLSEDALWAYIAEPDTLDESTVSHVPACPRCVDAAENMRRQCGILRATLPSIRSTGLHAQPLAGRYEFLRRLGAGGFGEVWQARDLIFGREVAIKMLRQDQLRPGALEMLRREAKALGELSTNRRARRHFVLAFDWLETPENAYLVMEYVEGGSLGDRIRAAGPLAWQLAVRYISDVGEALLATHGAGLVHCDIKPDNVLWDSTADEAMLADFGIAAKISDSPCGGTLGYIAPELVLEGASPASDVFALAATFYCLVAGRPPFPTTTVDECVKAAAAGLPVPDGSLARVPPEVEKIVRSALAPSPKNRPQLRAFIERLRGAGAFALAASIPLGKRPTAAMPDLGVEVFFSSDDRHYAPAGINAASSGEYRDLQFVPPEPPGYRVPESSFVRFRYRSESGGYLTLINVGSSGRIAVIFPNPIDPDNRIPPGGVKVVTVRVTPPGGTDEAIGILSANRDIPDEWRKKLGAAPAPGETPSGYDGYRDLEFISSSAAQAQAAGGWAVSVLKFHHDDSA